MAPLLAEFDFNVKFKNGESNLSAGALSIRRKSGETAWEDLYKITSFLINFIEDSVHYKWNDL